jgi:hypothetical protein
MKKIFVFLALAYAFTTGMAAATVVAHMDHSTIDELLASR